MCVIYTQVSLVAWWVLVVAGSLSLVALYNMNDWTVTTTDRKYFHLLAVMIFLPGILYAPQLTKLASIAAFTLFVITEVSDCSVCCVFCSLASYRNSKFLIQNIFVPTKCRQNLINELFTKPPIPCDQSSAFPCARQESLSLNYLISASTLNFSYSRLKNVDTVYAAHKVCSTSYMILFCVSGCQLILYVKY